MRGSLQVSSRSFTVDRRAASNAPLTALATPRRSRRRPRVSPPAHMSLELRRYWMRTL